MSPPPGPEGLKRSLRLGRAGLRVTGHALGDGLRSRLTGRERDWQPIADELRETLSGLRGPVLKIGQTVSQWQEVLPAPITDALGSLRSNVEPVAWPRIRARMADELGEAPETAFDWIDTQPLAAASLGQVHRARLADGTAVVVKAQYPDMDTICAADLRQLRRLLPLGRLLGIPGERLEAVHRELARVIERELDYEQERATLERFRQRYASRDDLVLPRPVPGYCTSGLLTLTEETGDPLAQARQWPAATRHKLAETLIGWAAESMLHHGELHADPHAGNFGFRRDGRLVVYDFGCTVPVGQRLTSAYAAGFRALQAGDPEALEGAMQQLGSRRPGTRPPWSLHRELIRIAGPAIQPGTRWDFGNGELHRQAMALSRRFMEWLGELQPPAEAILINRTMDGHYWNLHALDVELEVDRLISPWLSN
jgi:predicted unusual protein kinase regulating ubiquinone biosynthesis (AarF/ABC1/UbiB family)